MAGPEYPAPQFSNSHSRGGPPSGISCMRPVSLEMSSRWGPRHCGHGPSALTTPKRQAYSSAHESAAANDRIDMAGHLPWEARGRKNKTGRSFWYNVLGGQFQAEFQVAWICWVVA